MLKLKKYIVNIKSLDQDLPDMVVGSGDVNGRIIEVLFTQEAAAQFSDSMKVYLKWHHREKDIRGYVVFQEKRRDAWTLVLPNEMLHAGHVDACIELVDNISISGTTNFMIRITEDINTGLDFLETDTYQCFKKATIDMNSAGDLILEQMEELNQRFERLAAHLENKIDVAIEEIKGVLEVETPTEE